MGSIALHGFGVRWLHGALRRRAMRCRTTAPSRRCRTSARTAHVVEPDVAQRLQARAVHLRRDSRRPTRVEVHEVAREREFAPVKNAAGADSPETARALVAAEVRALVRRGRSTAAGARSRSRRSTCERAASD